MTITLLAGLFVLSVVIIAHELGHFTMAKLVGVYVKNFSIGFGKRIVSITWGETEYSIRILPFGGYVKMAGESEDEEEDDTSGIDPRRFFRNQRVLWRSAVVFAGPFMNYALAVVVYFASMFFLGVQVLPTTTVGVVLEGSPADSAGLVPGDEIVSVQGKPVASWSDLIAEIVSGAPGLAKRLQVKRGERLMEIDIRYRIEDDRYVLGLRPLIPPKVGRVKRGSPAERVGMHRGATIKAIGDSAVASYRDIERMIHRSPGRPLLIKWSLAGRVHVDTIVPEPKKVPKEGSIDEFDIVGQIGVGPPTERKAVSFLTSWSRAFASTHGMIGQILWFLKQLFTGNAGLKSLGGPILITQMAGDMARWGFNYLLYFLAFFSINLFIFNLMPLLPFDGGHLTFFAFEAVTGRRVPARLREILTQAGFAMVIALMVLVVVMDISRCSGASPGIL